MASPVDFARQTSTFTSAVDPWSNVAVGAAPGATDLAFVYCRTGGGSAFNTPSGWTALLANDASDATDDVTSIFYHYGVGSASITVDLTGTAKGAAIGWTITGAVDPAIQAPEIHLPISDGIFTTAANAANPPSITPTGGAKDYLFLALAGLDGESQTFTHGTHINVVNADSGTGGAVATNCRIAGGSRQLTTISYDAAAFTHATAATGGTAFIIAIHPAAAVVRKKRIIIENREALNRSHRW
jgi:hypothetical protein